MSTVLREKSRVSVVLVFFTTLAVTGLAAAGHLVADYSRARASYAWGAVEGVVLTVRSGAPDEYVYSVRGYTHESSRNRFFTGLFSASTLEKNLRPGDRVEVFVSPREPSFSVLERGGSGVTFAVFFLLSAVSVFAGLGGIVRTLEVTLHNERLARSEAY